MTKDPRMFLVQGRLQRRARISVPLAKRQGKTMQMRSSSSRSCTTRDEAFRRATPKLCCGIAGNRHARFERGPTISPINITM